MIKYRLVCTCEHIFDVWFSNSKDYDVQIKNKLVQCPCCMGSSVRKAPMIPAVAKGKNTSKIQENTLKKLINTVKEHVENNYEYVGDNLARAARSMHYGEQEKRAIYGEVKIEEAMDLAEEGIDLHLLPDIFTPKAHKKLN